MNGHVPQLIPEANSDIIEKAFEGDQLKRSEIAEQLTGYISRLGRGSVIAIDAPWGEGKTWFARHWNISLEAKGYKTLYIDAFKQDYIEDPFILISAEFSILYGNDKKNKDKFIESASKVGKALLPTMGKIAINIAGNLAGVSDLSEKIADGAEGPISDLIGETFESKIKEYDAEKAGMESFKVSIKDFAAKNEKPVIILIDELDRCRPTFAIKLIERIKHFFDVPNIVFVLFVNRSQLDRSIEVLYGLQTENSTYLNKFINMQFTLPKVAPSEYEPTSSYNIFIQIELSKYKYPNNMQDDFVRNLELMANVFNLSLRDIERACHYIALAPNTLSPFICYLSALKTKYPELIALLKNNDPTAHNKCIELLDNSLIRLKDNITLQRVNVIKSIVKHHKESNGLLTESDKISTEDRACLGQSIMFQQYGHKDIISIIARRIDLLGGRS